MNEESCIGCPWYIYEEKQLLEMLTNKVEINEIAKSLKRTVGGVRSRIKYIAFKMHRDNIPINEIISKTHLNESQIMKIVERKARRSHRKNIKIKKISKELIIVEIKKEIQMLNQRITSMNNILSLLERLC